MTIPCVGPRVLEPEVMDTLPYEEAEQNLREIARLNRHWGGHSTLRSLLREAVGDRKTFTLLDVGAASGDMAERIHEWYPQATVVSLDYIPTHLTECPQPKVAGDAFQLPFAPRSFDFVFSSLFLHHFTNDQVEDLLRKFGVVARRAVLVIDLERNPIPYYFLAWSQPFQGWHPVTVSDGQISVAAAFRAPELAQLARKAGFSSVRTKAYRPAFRVTLQAFHEYERW